jgi:NADH-quinone oxidoreductase subunit M
MPDVSNWFLAVAAGVPLIAAAARRGRMLAITAAAVSVLCVAGAASSTLHGIQGTAATSAFTTQGPLFRVDAMTALPMLLFSLLVLAVLVAAPRSDGQGWGYSGTLVLLAGTLATYGAATPFALFAGWIVSALPLMLRMWPPEKQEPARPGLPLLAVSASVVLMGAGLLLIFALPSAAGGAFALIVLGAIIRKGVFPFHTWMVAAFADGPLLAVGLFANAHLGAFVIARVAIPLMPELSRDALTLLSNLALVSALYSAFAGLGERNPRRSLALLMISQSSFILAGLESRNPEGITGALTFWAVVSVATMGLLIVYRALEKRCSWLTESEFAGLASSAPRFAVYFAVCGLALVGLPGTLGFAAEDLLFHGALSGHRLLGVALPLATALNAINIYRLFSSLFFGRRATRVPAFPDALARERLVLSMVVLFLVLGGIAPRLIISSRVAAAEAISAVLSGSEQGDGGQ